MNLSMVLRRARAGRGAVIDAGLGRDRSVLRQSWRAGEDPGATQPEEDVLAAGWTAADAADLARKVSHIFPEHGYDKSAGFWWARDGKNYHRFRVVGPERRRVRRAALAGAVGASAALGLLAAWTGRRRSARKAVGGS